MQTKKRLLVLLGAYTFLTFLLIIRVGWIQFVQGSELQRLAYEQQSRSRIISPRRGTIYDRNGIALAVSASVDTISAFPKELQDSGADLEAVAEKLAELLDMSKEEVLAKISKNSPYEYIKRKVEPEVGAKVRAWLQEAKIVGITVDEDTKRYYPKRNLASHVLGCVGTDNQGLEGIEKAMEQYLKGLPGRILSEVDAKGRQIPFNRERHIDPQDGYNVVLTIDETIQYLAEKAIEKAIVDNKVLKGAVAIVMDPNNGEVLAMASKPDFDPNSPFRPLHIDDATWNSMSMEERENAIYSTWRNKALADTYEPGSTFKAITASAGLEEGVITPESRVNDFTVTVGGHRINCWKPNAHGEESFAQGLQMSCNPVFVRVAQDLGIDRFYKYMRAFGFYDKTGIELPEADIIIHKRPTEIDMAVASFGQRFKVTPLHMVTAYCAIANGGTLIRPHLVKEITDNEGNVIKKFEPEIVRQVISKKTSDTMRKLLQDVVTLGTGSRAYVPGYRVAGKTGTSETETSDIDGRYVASFMAFAPADNPRIVVLVALDHPDVYPHTGGIIAAPVAGKLVEDILSYLQEERVYTEKDRKKLAEDVYVPDVRGKTLKEAESILREAGFEYRIEGDATNKDITVKEQTPKPETAIPRKSTIVLYTYKPDENDMVVVPDLLNKTVDEAVAILKGLGLNIKVNGEGRAYRQNYQQGSRIPRGGLVEVFFMDPDEADLE